MPIMAFGMAIWTLIPIIRENGKFLPELTFSDYDRDSRKQARDERRKAISAVVSGPAAPRP